mgnify:CR=1 FL=1
MRALDGVSLTVEDGEFIAVVGTSGCGKTTLMNILGGLDTSDFGGVWIRNTSLKDLNKEERRYSEEEISDLYFSNII